jgi:glycerol-3-phosphate acyltransferase PlsX
MAGGKLVHLFVDATGGDHAPAAQVAGSIAALRADPDLKLTLGGDIRVLEGLAADAGDVAARLQLRDTPEVITNHDAPAIAIRQKKRSAIVEGMLSVRSGETDGFVSAGSTGGVLLGGMLRLGRVKGVERPALAPLLPNGKSSFLLIDCGANVDCRPDYLVQFGIMGDIYMQHVMGVKNPRVGLVNIGEEPEKGNALYKDTYPLMQQADFNFVGNIEARYITQDKADVVVCDGFNGNLILKFMEGVAETLLKIIKQELLADTRSKMGALLAKPAFGRVKKHMDYSEVGGAPLLGVAGSVVKAHGSSNAKAFESAIRQAVHMVQGNVARIIDEKINA